MSFHRRSINFTADFFQNTVGLYPTDVYNIPDSVKCLKKYLVRQCNQGGPEVVGSCCVSDVICCVCCKSQQNGFFCLEPLGTWECACLRCCTACMPIFWQPALFHCHSCAQRGTLTLFYTDTYLTSMPLTLTLLQADECVPVCLIVISHQTDTQTLA